jgi:non-specific serine/threonine protein kinase/serine/threonine-protein kinase
MADPDLGKARQIFGEALQRPPEDRSVFVDSACGDDDALRRKIQRLLAAHTEAGEFLADPTAISEIETILQTPEPPPMPERIGRYTIRRIIAQGGMGVVYEAVQAQPHRTVALKVMRPGLASASVLRRFEYESQVLARLRHPNIAPVYEAGTHDDVAGPVAYFAMEYIPNARPLVEYAEAKNLTITQRLELFARVCDAVHHGHQKGVIHRDLKPGNILVDPEGSPKIIDFGVARATDSDLAVTTLQTDVGQLIGTLQYMSPEQCEADPHDIDSRSDVYALGVVLYELLCARLPYKVGHAAVHEAVRVIRDESPVRPSTIDRRLRGDLETITLTALEKERSRRYQSANDLAADIRRYLGDEPIVARPASALYQVRKFARRNKAIVTAALAMFLLLIVGIAGTSAGFLRARSQAHRATITSEYLMRLFGVEGSEAYADPESGTEIVTLEQLVDGASDEVDAMLSEWPDLRADMHFRLGRVYWRLADNDGMGTHLRQAHELYEATFGEGDPRTLVSLFWYAYWFDRETRYAEAEPLHRRAVEGLADTCGPGDRRTLSAALRLAINLRWQAKYREAEELFRRSLETARRELGESDRVTLGTVRHYAYLLHNRARYVEEESLLRPALEAARETYPQGDLVLARLWWGLGHSLRRQGRYTEAIEAFQAAHVAFHYDNPGVIHPAMTNTTEYAKTLSTLQRHAEAESLLRRKLEDCRHELGENHQYTLWARYELGDQLRCARRGPLLRRLRRGEPGRAATRARRVGGRASGVPPGIRSTDPHQSGRLVRPHCPKHPRPDPAAHGPVRGGAAAVPRAARGSDTGARRRRPRGPGGVERDRPLPDRGGQARRGGERTPRGACQTVRGLRRIRPVDPRHALSIGRRLEADGASRRGRTGVSGRVHGVSEPARR